MPTEPVAPSVRPQFQPMRSLLLHLSESKRLAPVIMNLGVSRRVARRFVAGETLEDAFEAARAVNRDLQLASLDHLGENVDDEAGARRTAEGYLSVFDRIAAEKLDANVSLKLTQLGLDLGVSLCEELLEAIVARAASRSNFVRVDMEGSAYTQRTIDIVKRVRAKRPNVGTVMQAYLYRTEQDVRELLEVGCRIRLCKGAYNEPPEACVSEKGGRRRKLREADENPAAQWDLPRNCNARSGDDRSHEERLRERKTSPASNSSFKCCTAYGPTFRSNSSAKGIACASTFRTARIGFPTSCGGSQNVRLI